MSRLKSAKAKLIIGIMTLVLLLSVINAMRFMAPTKLLSLAPNFEKHVGNPLTTIPLYTASGVVHPDVLYFSEGKDGYKYWMVYTPFEPERNPCIVRSNDGISWTDTGITNPVANEGVLDSDPDMIYVSALNIWLMVCTTYWSEESQVWLAYSIDGKSWTKYDGVAVNGNTNPYILSGTDSGKQPWEYVGLYSKVTEPTLFYEDGTFYLYYCTWTPDENRGKVGLATFTWNNTSNDIQNFQRNAGNPLIDLAADGIFKSGCGHLDVSRLGPTYYMYVNRELSGSANYELALLTSADKTSWTNQGRVLQRGPAGAWDSYHIYRSSPAVDPTGTIVLFDGQVKLYYSAWRSSVAYGNDPKIGLATGTLSTNANTPQYRNAGPANGTKIGVGANVTLYAQGYDDTALDWAWVWTNETGGAGKNYTDIYDFQPSVSNPIIDADTLFGSGKRTEDSKVVKLNGAYYMAVSSGTSGATMDIYMLNSSSLTGPWVLMNNGNPIISRNASGWDAQWLRVQGPIVYYNGIYYLYYMGGRDTSTFRIGVATATDASFPTTWTKYSGNPILSPTGSGWESTCILSLSIQRIGPPGNEWYGHYGALGGGYYATGVCYSSSPYGPFTRYPGNPIIQRDAGTWDNLGPLVKDMIKIGDTIYGAYEAGGDGHWQCGMYSGEIVDDILNVAFSKHPDNPIISGDEGSGTETANPAWYYENRVIYLFINTYSANWRYYDLFSSCEYGSPLNTNNVADTWTWSNFTWCNPGIADGTRINWRIYYSDTSGNENVTDTHYFTVKTEAPEYDYVDLNTSDMDMNGDKGTHSDFDAEKAVDDSHDTLTEQSASGFGLMSYRKSITINGAYVDGDQSNFPVLIDIYDRGLHDHVQSDGDDIDFTDSSGSNLDHEIEYFNREYNSTHAHLIAWVRANLTGASNTRIYMIYGNPVVGSQQNPTGVWDSNYKGVWHLNASSSPDRDSSANNQAAVWFRTPVQTQAQIGMGKDFDAGDGTKTAEDADHTAASITVEGWINGDTFSNTETWNEATFFQRYFTYYFMISKDAANRGKPKVYVYTSGVSGWRLANTALEVGTWHHIAFTYTSGSLKIYIDGILDKEYTDVTGNVQAGGAGPLVVYFGAQDSANPFRTLDGKLDEMRFSRGVRSPEWLNLTYQNAANLKSFLSVGSEEPRPPTNYELDLEIQWTNVEYTRSVETMCIKTGSFTGSEDIQVRVWNSADSSWRPIMNLAANQWNNVSVEAYLTESTFTVQFLGRTESGDATQDSWNIDCSLIRTRTIPHVCTLTIDSAGGGTTDPPTGTYTYHQGQSVPVQAIPNSGYLLDHWELDGSNVGDGLSYTVTMNDDHSLAAIFRLSTPPAVPEFPLGSVMPLAILPLLFYLWWKRRQKTPP